jgi:hypothetical protein
MDANRVIDLLGGTYAAAKFFEVTPGAVSQWRSSGIPRARLMFLRAARPDVFEAACGCGDKTSQQGHSGTPVTQVKEEP